MAPIRHVRRSTSETRRSDYYQEGDLVLVKTADYPSWPAKITRPEYFRRRTDGWRYFVQLFGINEQAFVEPSNIKRFTGEVKIRPRGKSNLAKCFAIAVKEISEAFERKRKSSLKYNQTSASLLLELENEAARGEKTSALSESNGEDAVPSIQQLVALAKESKLKKAPSQSLWQNLSRSSILGSAVQPREYLFTGGSLSTDAVVARDAFRGTMEILSDTKESIHCAARLASDCAQNGIANEVIELIIEKLESEQTMNGRVKFFFLVDSIMKRSHRKKDIVGACFITIVQDQLPRLLEAAAPLGVSPQVNHQQCAKILRLWIKRNILPKSYLQPYVDDIELLIRNSSLNDSTVIGQSRVTDGRLIEEYGSNITLQSPADHLLPRVSVDEDEIPKISCNQELKMEDVLVPHKEKKDTSAQGNGSDRREWNSPPSPPDSPPPTPPLPTSPMPPLPPNPRSRPQPPPPDSPHLTPPLPTSPMPPLPPIPGGSRPPPPPPDSPPPTPPLPTSPMPPLPPIPGSRPPPPPPFPLHDPIQYSSHLQRPLPPMGPWGQPLIPLGQRPTYGYYWRPT